MTASARAPGRSSNAIARRLADRDAAPVRVAGAARVRRDQFQRREPAQGHAAQRVHPAHDRRVAQPGRDQVRRASMKQRAEEAQAVD